MEIYRKNDDEIKIFPVGHASLYLEYKGKVIHVDPVSSEGDYSRLPKADLVLVTHSHFDHLDKKAIDMTSTGATEIILNKESYQKLKRGTPLANGEQTETCGFLIQAVPAYNSTSGRGTYHPKGRDNGYVISLGDIKIYIAGDTEIIPEMSQLENIDIVFLPMNQPYTMTAEQAGHAARLIKPVIVYPYHFSESIAREFSDMLEGEKTEVRILDF